MKKTLLFILFALIALAAAAQELTVASYNIRYANQGDAERGNGWESRCPWVCKLIDFHGFDIFGAQEVRDNQLHDMLAQLPDYTYIGVGRDDGKTAGEYSPIFYKKERFRLLEQGTFWLSDVTDRPNKGWDAALPRICTWGHFYDKQTERRFWFFNLHMDHRGVKAREESAKLIVSKIREMCNPKEFVILTGDFNVDQNNPVYSIFTSSGILADSFVAAEKQYAPNGTFNNFNPSLKTESRIDHIFVSPSITVRNYGVLTDTYRTETAESDKEIKSEAAPGEISFYTYQARVPSDHFPVVVRIGF
ncbi:endonuclease/exonuclease/phosphatase family protein [uncultured Alistipes sp.]|uniref:endonuclease/exonuclease/phosphatase family protein n=1 Tax=uncultured Alistipes sp. TaxID=538949 RepID=UPI0025E03F25|nr:endonuclease/exonuclease/phosphatase family protein [uncultured Alistipes sp.]